MCRPNVLGGGVREIFPQQNNRFIHGSSISRIEGCNWATPIRTVGLVASALVLAFLCLDLEGTRHRNFTPPDSAPSLPLLLQHVRLPGLAGVDPQDKHIPDATRSSFIFCTGALSLERQELQRCVFVSLGPPHEMQMPDATSSALMARCDELNLSPQTLQRCVSVSVSFGPPQKMHRPDATRSALSCPFQRVLFSTAGTATSRLGVGRHAARNAESKCCALGPLLSQWRVVLLAAGIAAFALPPRDELDPELALRARRSVLPPHGPRVEGEVGRGLPIGHMGEAILSDLCVLGSIVLDGLSGRCRANSADGALSEALGRESKS